MQNKKGFTLIELIIVIVILGILAVTVAPRFFGLSSSAYKATAEGFSAQLESGIQIGHASTSQSDTRGSCPTHEYEKK